MDDRDHYGVPLHVEMQRYIDTVMALQAMSDINRRHYGRDSRPVVGSATPVIACPECRAMIHDYDDHETGCPNWGALPGDFR